MNSKHGTATRLLIDLTDLEKWSGIHGGIQRVVYGIAKEFFLHNDDAVIIFVAFDNDRKVFYKTSFEPIYKRVESRGESVVPEHNAVVDVSPARRALAWRVARRVKSILPPPQSARVADNVPEELIMTNKDTLFVIGMSWESPNMQDTLFELRRTKGVKVVQVVYDLIISLYPHLHHPANYEPYTKNMIGVMKSSDLLLPISSSSKADIEKFATEHKLKAPRTSVIRLGDALSGRGVAVKPRTEKRLNPKFILCVGTIEIRKNHTLLYYTYKLAKQRGVKLPQLVIVGGQGWFTGDIQYLLSTDPEIQQDIVVLSGVHDDELRWLYKHCQFTVYPSMYEGWGLPIAESLAYGKVCVSSSTSSMKEIGGGLIDYFSPYSSEECFEKILKYTNRDYLTKAEKAIMNQYKVTTWSDTYGHVIKVLGYGR